jgi:hypothetical protein
MSIVLAKPPVEVDVSAQAPGGEGFEFVETELASYIHQCWDRAKFAKQTITERLLQCERQRRGVYDPDKAMEIAQRVATNAPLTNYALMHALPRIAEQPADQGFFTEAMMAAIAQSAPEAKQRVRDFLEGKAAKVAKTS